LRKEISRLEKTEAHKFFGLHTELPVIMVFGGSKGAHSINSVILEHINELLSKTQIIHISGSLDWQDVQNVSQSLPEDLARNYHAFSYLHEEMSAAFSSADLCICRSGASTLGELPFFGLPAILVPYPYAWRYQKTNAQYLVDHKAAYLIPDGEMGAKLLSTIFSLIESPHELEEMKSAMRKLSKPDAAHQIASLIINQVKLANQKGGLN
jgi:UDP-N-acetylglucosamine--N-acetylmuramyl-(pentapeptide) pyrophosphoryl-undecaprenol N-acetylglucosamine transferase